MPKTIYVIGPVTEREGLNRPAFERAAARLEEAGYRAVIPHDFVPDDATHERAMRMTLQWMIRNADGVCLLDGWPNSPGARIESAVADAVGIMAGGLDWWLSAAKGCPGDCLECDDLLYAGEGDWWCPRFKRVVGDRGRIPGPEDLEGMA